MMTLVIEFRVLKTNNLDQETEERSNFLAGWPTLLFKIIPLASRAEFLTEDLFANRSQMCRNIKVTTDCVMLPLKCAEFSKQKPFFFLLQQS